MNVTNLEIDAYREFQIYTESRSTVQNLYTTSNINAAVQIHEYCKTSSVNCAIQNEKHARKSS